MLSYQGVALLEKVRWCGLVGKSVSLGLGVEVSKAQARFSGFSLPGDCRYTELSATTPALCLPAYCHVPHHDNGLNL